jgi:iron complex transport system ATP-binding protein
MGIAGWLGDIVDWFSLFHLLASTPTSAPINVMTKLYANNLNFSVEGCSILDNVSLSVSSGDWLGIAGLNGSGKSTLLKCMAGLLIPSSGQMSMDGRPYSEVDYIHRKLSIMSQRTDVLTAMSVLDLVRLGRYPHLPAWSFSLSSIDHEHVEYALDFTGLNDFRYRQVDTLSGGERQRAFLALSLAQDGSVLLFDEPTNHLDLVAQIQILSLLRRLADQGKVIVSVLHDLNQLSKYCSRLALLRGGALVAEGLTDQAFTSSNLKLTFGLDIDVVRSHDRLCAII